MKIGPAEQWLVVSHLEEEQRRRARRRYEEETIVAEILARQERG